MTPNTKIFTDLLRESRAFLTVSAAEYGAALDLRLCDGLRGIAPHEADTVVIAGMGGETIIQILTDSPWPSTPVWPPGGPYSPAAAAWAAIVSVS